MWAETSYRIFHANQMEEEQRSVELGLIDRMYKEYLYHSDMLVYSLGAHFTSSFFNLGDILRSFKLSKALASISLNLPYKYYSRIKKTRQTVFREYTNTLLNFAKDIDPCTVYLALLENLVEANEKVFADGLNLDINRILDLSGLPPKEVLQKDILDEMQQIYISDGEFSLLYNSQKEHGISLFKTFGIEGGLNLHPAFLIEVANNSKNTVFQKLDDEEIESGTFEESDAVKRYFEFRELERQMNQIMEEQKKRME
jgi:hypothetical protein